MVKHFILEKDEFYLFYYKAISKDRLLSKHT